MRRAVLAMMMLVGSASLGYGESVPVDQQGITVSNAWARASPGTVNTGAVYFTISDTGTADRLIGVSTPVAGKAELHETKTEGGIMRMRAVIELPLEPGKSLTLVPGGYHVMLMELRQPLKVGDEFPLTLSFARAAPITVRVKTEAAGAAAPSRGMHEMPSAGTNKP